MLSEMQFIVSAYFSYAKDTLSLAAASARLWAVGYAMQHMELRSRFGRLQMELYAATLS